MHEPVRGPAELALTLCSCLTRCWTLATPIGHRTDHRPAGRELLSDLQRPDKSDQSSFSSAFKKAAAIQFGPAGWEAAEAEGFEHRSIAGDWVRATRCTNAVDVGDVVEQGVADPHLDLVDRHLKRLRWA